MSPRKKSKRRPKRKRDDADVTPPESTAADVTPPETTAADVTPPELTPSHALMLYREEVVPLEQRSSFNFDEDGEDCDVVDDEDCDEIGYEAAGEEEREDEHGNPEDLNEEEDLNPEAVGDDEEVVGLGVEEEVCNDFEAEFGADVRVEEDETDADSGDDMFDDEKIPPPMSESEDEDEDNGRRENVQAEDPEALLYLGKTFSSPSDFKIVVLRYSLKTRYDIKLYRSQSMRIGAKCADKDVGCEWRCYCAYEKKEQRLRVNVFTAKHICVRSGYTHMLKRGTIAWLFADRLRKNPRITKQEMVSEIKREYNLEVSEEQCSKAKTIVRRESRASHQENFSRIWDYQAEILRSNKGSVFEIETIPGPAIGNMQRFYRLFICFKSQKDSWKNTCRPIIGIDGAFLKWDIKGHLLAAVGRDGDNRIVPIAWAVVEI